jgi:hypothetical protein
MLEIIKKATKFSVGGVVKYTHICKRNLPKAAKLTNELKYLEPLSSIEGKSGRGFTPLPL